MTRQRPVFTAKTKRVVCVAGILAALSGCASPQLSGNTPHTSADISRVESYLNNLRGLRAKFVQVWPDGGTASGNLSYDPAHMRLDYTVPHSMLLVAAGGHLAFRDDGNHSLTRIGLAHNPLGLLLQYPLKLSGDITVTSVTHTGGTLQISLAKTANPSQGLLTLDFSDLNGALNLVEIQGVDERQHHMQLHLYDNSTGAAFDTQTFVLPKS